MTRPPIRLAPIRAEGWDAPDAISAEVEMIAPDGARALVLVTARPVYEDDGARIPDFQGIAEEHLTDDRDEPYWIANDWMAR